MHPSDVRIGNVVKYHGRIFRIETIAEIFPTLDTNEFAVGSIKWHELRYVRLTHTILESLGFIVVGEAGNTYYNRLAKVRGILIHDGEFFDLRTHITIRYAHRLQNFVHATHGYELIFDRSVIASKG